MFTSQQQTDYMSKQESDVHKGDGISWWLKAVARVAGTLGGIGAMVFGTWACVTLTASCLAAGIVLMLCGFIVVAFEAPCCCQCLDFIDSVNKFSENRPYWHKALGYGILSIPPLAICPEVSTILGGIIIFIPATLYGMMALGKKADRDTMLATARGQGHDSSMKAELVFSEQAPARSPPPPPTQQTGGGVNLPV